MTNLLFETDLCEYFFLIRVSDNKMMEHTELIREMALLERWTAQDRLKLAKQRREKQVARWFENEQSTQSESNSSLNHRKKLLNVQFPENIILLEGKFSC